MCEHVCVYHSIHVEIRGHLAEVSSLLPLCWSQGENTCHQFCWKVSLPDEPVLNIFVFSIIILFPKYKTQEKKDNYVSF